MMRHANAKKLHVYRVCVREMLKDGNETLRLVNVSLLHAILLISVEVSKQDFISETQLLAYATKHNREKYQLLLLI